MASASFELQKSLYAALSAYAPLGTLLGGPHIFDEVPRGAQHPYVAFGQLTVRDWSTGSEQGDEHNITLHVWSREPGHRQAHRIAEAIRDCLHEAALLIDGHRLINLRHETTELRREGGGERYRGFLRFRAVTEPATG